MKKIVYSLLFVSLLIAYSCKKDEETKNNSAPVITLKGSIDMIIHLDSTFTDSGFTAIDEVYGDISSSVMVSGTVDTSKIGTYIISYNVSNVAGNKAQEKIRTVKVKRFLNPQKVQNGFAIMYTFAGEENSGNWGAELIHRYADEAPNGAIISAHLNVLDDPMYTPITYSFAYDRSYMMGIPSFYVGDIKTNVFSSMTNLLTVPAEIGIDYSYSIEGDSMLIDTKCKFFYNCQGDFYLSVLILEDSIDGSSNAPLDYQQAGTTISYPNDDYTHDFVLHASSVADSAYGEFFIQNPVNNTEVEKSYSIMLDPKWKNAYPVCIIWKYVAGTKPEYHYVNAFKRKN